MRKNFDKLKQVADIFAEKILDVTKRIKKFMKEKSKKKRPDGLDVAQYENCESWYYHQWAWEFLRRNDKFIAACKKVKLGELSKQKVASKFCLQKFKYYTESYSKKIPPKFSIVTPFLWHNLDEKPRIKNRVELNLYPGQIIVRIDLAASVEQKGAIETQVNEAKKLIDEKVSDYMTRNKDLTKQHRRKEETFGIYIRLLDLKAAGKTNLECAEILLRNESKNKFDPDYLRENIKQRLRAAKIMAGNDYRYLSVREGRPKEGTKIPLEVNASWG